jgi:hypothetical protein
MLMTRELSIKQGPEIVTNFLLKARSFSVTQREET